MSYIIFISFLYIFSNTFIVQYAQSLENENLKNARLVEDTDNYLYHAHVITEKGRCGGSIIHESFVVTAAHCVTIDGIYILTGSIRIIAGTKDLSKKPYIEEQVAKTFVTRKYNYVKPYGDIAILKLLNPLNLNGPIPVRKINLPKDYKDKINEQKTAFIVSFGDSKIVDYVYDDDTNRLTKVLTTSDNFLRYADIRLVSTSQCQSEWSVKRFLVFNKKLITITKDHICGKQMRTHPEQETLPGSEYEAVCRGDSGSGLIQNNVLYGIASFSSPYCDNNSMSAVFTYVPKFLDFIYDVLNNKIDDQKIQAVDNFITTTSTQTTV